MSETVAPTLPAMGDAAPERPTVLRALLWVGLGGAIGIRLGWIVMLLPHALGVAAFNLDSPGDLVFFPNESLGAALALTTALDRLYVRPGRAANVPAATIVH